MKWSLILLLLITGCGSLPLRPGLSVFRSPTFEAGVKQSQNPQQETVQKYEKITEPAASVTNSVRTIERVETHIGAAQKDTAREVGAKLRSLSGVVWVGVLLFLFGIASFVYPPIRALIGSVTTSALIIAAGLGLIILPSLIVGHELLILGICVAAVAFWWFAHRHGAARGELKAIKEKSNGV